MLARKVVQRTVRGKVEVEYDHYVALDWSLKITCAQTTPCRLTNILQMKGGMERAQRVFEPSFNIAIQKSECRGLCCYAPARGLPEMSYIELDKPLPLSVIFKSDEFKAEKGTNKTNPVRHRPTGGDQ